MPKTEISPELKERILNRIKEIAKEIDPEDKSCSQLGPSDQENWIKPPYEIFSDDRGKICVTADVPPSHEVLAKVHPQLCAELGDEVELVSEWANDMRVAILSTIAGAGIGAHRKSMKAMPKNLGHEVEFASVDDLILSLNAMAKDQSQKINLTELPKSLVGRQ